MTAFALHELGAGSIHATCQHDLARFRLARSTFGADNVVYYPETEITDLTGLLDDHQFDVVIASAMLHHLPSPLDALLLCRRPAGRSQEQVNPAATLPVERGVTWARNSLARSGASGVENSESREGVPKVGRAGHSTAS